MRTCQQVEQALRAEMAQLSDAELKYFAEFTMDVHPDGMSREEIESACVAAEQYAFVH